MRLLDTWIWLCRLKPLEGQIYGVLASPNSRGMLTGVVSAFCCPVHYHEGANLSKLGLTWLNQASLDKELTLLLKIKVSTTDIESHQRISFHLRCNTCVNECKVYVYPANVAERI